MLNNNSLIGLNDILSNLNEDQLRELNHKIIERLKLINRSYSTIQVAKFNLGDRVYFEHNGRKLIGTVVRLNQKSVSVELENNQQWRVAPQLLKKIIG